MKENSDAILNVIVAILVLAGVLIAFFTSIPGIGKSKMEIVASGALQNGLWVITGRVIYDGVPIEEKTMWVIASDDVGNRYSPVVSEPAVSEDSTGFFRTGPIPRTLSSDSTRETTEVAIFARVRTPADTTQVVEGKEILTLGSRGRSRWVAIPIGVLILIPGIFSVSIILALIRASGGLLKVQYYGSIILAFVLTFVMIGYISIGLRFVNVTGSDAEVLSLGFGNVHKGTYVAGTAEEWLFSLTAPTPYQEPVADTTASAANVVRGFGVPLWILLLSVVGAGLLTISLIVKYVVVPPDFGETAPVAPPEMAEPAAASPSDESAAASLPEEPAAASPPNKPAAVSPPDDPPAKRSASGVRQRVQEIVKHQFYILFSPLGAIVVYQFLIVAGAASETTTVAIAALAAGLSLNWVLDKAIKSVGQMFQ